MNAKRGRAYPKSVKSRRLQIEDRFATQIQNDYGSRKVSNAEKKVVLSMEYLFGMKKSSGKR